MDVARILKGLRQEREQVEQAIRSLELLVRARGVKKGRPPAWMTVIAVKRRGRPPGSQNKVRNAGANGYPQV